MTAILIIRWCVHKLLSKNLECDGYHRFQKEEYSRLLVELMEVLQGKAFELGFEKWLDYQHIKMTGENILGRNNA